MASNQPHRINLSRMWKRVDSKDRQTFWVDLPDVSSEIQKTPVRLVRYFNRPTGLDAGSKVYLVVENSGQEIQLRFNETDFDFADRVDITSELQPSNQIEIEVREVSEAGWRVWLEIDMTQE